MIKRIIACLTICLIITGLISPVFSDASALPQPNWSDPGISEIINISDLTGWMLNGGTYDVSTYTDAESFMNDYYAARTKTRLEGSDYQVKSSFGLEQQYYTVGDSAYAHELDVNRVIASSYRDHTGYGRRFSEQVNDALLTTGHLYDTKIPLLNEIEFANFVGYNHNALNLYSNLFPTNESPTPSPDPNFLFIENIKYIKGRTTENSNDIRDLNSYSVSQIVRAFDNAALVVNYSVPVSYCGIDLTNYHTASIGNSSNILTATPCVGVGSIYLTTNNDNTISANYINCNFDSHPINNWNTNVSLQYVLKNNYLGTQTTGTTPVNYLQANFNNLSDAINYIYKHYAYINLYVDNVPWVLVDNVVTPSITPEFPDAVGGEDLPSTTWPVFRPRAPYYTTAPGVLQAVEDAIRGDGVLDLDDLKPYLTDENGDPVPDPIFDPEPVPLPVPDPVNPDVVPGLPVLPAIPPEMPGFNGVSVLAEIINFTNQSLPTSLIVTFWGIVFGIVILGLIKILHK